MTSLTSKQRAYLRKMAHHLKPLVLVGSEGVTPSVVGSITEAFNTRELLKVKLQESAPISVREAADRLTGAVEASHAVQVIGKTIVLFRADLENPQIRLPEKGG